MLEQRSICCQTGTIYMTIPRTEKFDIREGKGEEESADTYNKYIFDISYAACTDQEKQGLVTVSKVDTRCLKAFHGVPWCI